MKKNQSGFGVAVLIVALLLVAVIATIGTVMIHTRTKDASVSSTNATSKHPGVKNNAFANNESQTAGIFQSSELGLKFTYPSNWNIINYSAAQGALFLFRSPNFILDPSNNVYSIRGTQISLSVPKSHPPFDEDKAHYADPNTPFSGHDVTDLIVDGKEAFSYSETNPNTNATENVVEVDRGDKGIVAFFFEPSVVNGASDKSDKPAFDSLIKSVRFF